MSELALALDRLFQKPSERRRVASLLSESDQIDDVLQDLAERLLRGDQRVETPKSYLRRAAHNIAINVRRAATRRTAYEQDFATQPGQQAASVEDQVDAACAMERLYEALDELPALTRILFIQCYLQGETQSRLAQQHGLHLSTIEKQLSKAKRHCYQQLAEYLD